MWHTYYSTGERQIDEDHANIDFLLDLCANSADDWPEQARAILDAFARHMDIEERICEERRLDMTEEHRGEHIYLKSKLREMHQQIVDGEIGKSVFVDFTRKMLLFHVSYFDLDLKSA